MSFPRTIAVSLVVGALAVGGLAAAGPQAIGPEAASLRLASSDDAREHGAAAQGEALPVTELLRRLSALGYSEFREVERDGARYEVEARDRDGRWRELYVDARSGKVLREEFDD